MRRYATAVIFGIVAAAGMAAISPVGAAQTQKPAPAPGQCMITGGTNYGTITQNCVVNPLPPPVVLLMPKFEDAPATPPKMGFQHRIIARLSATEDLIVVACGDGVTDVLASPWPAGMVVEPDERHQGNCIAKRYQNAAAGKWLFEVDTVAADTKFTLTPALQ